MVKQFDNIKDFSYAKIVIFVKQFPHIFFFFSVDVKHTKNPTIATGARNVKRRNNQKNKKITREKSLEVFLMSIIHFA